jgi:hypothetical protein
MNMKKLSIAVLLTAGAIYAGAADGEAAAAVIMNEVAVKPNQKIVVSSDKGKVTVTSSDSATLTYRVEFVPDQKGSWFNRAPQPTPAEYAQCSAVYSDEQGLKIRTAKGISAVVTIAVPARQALDAQLSAGVLTIGSRSGKVDAFIGEGILEYDSAGLPAGTCVVASINAGTVSNNRDFNCGFAGAVLHGHSGIITVK